MKTIYTEDICDFCRSRNERNKKFDLVIADPPFGLNFDGKPSNYNRNSTYVVKGYNEAPAERYASWCTMWLKLMYDITSNDATCYVFSGWQKQHQIIRAATELNLWQQRNHLIWQYAFGVYCKNRYVSSHYHIICLTKNDKPVFNDGAYGLDVMQINKEYKIGQKRYPNMLPKQLIKVLVETSSNKGDLVLDAFSGGGTTREVCKELKRKVISVDNNIESKKFIEEKEKENV